VWPEQTLSAIIPPLLLDKHTFALIDTDMHSRRERISSKSFNESEQKELDEGPARCFQSFCLNNSMKLKHSARVCQSAAIQQMISPFRTRPAADVDGYR
jgi:hypothetical protein